MEECKMKRENELLLKGVNVEITKVLRDFNDIMNATLGDTVTSHAGAITRLATLQDTIDLYQNEWCNTIQLLDKIGIEVETELESPKNHYDIYGKLADSEKEKYLDFNGMEVMYDKVYVDENGLGDTILTLYRNDIDSEIARILLKRNKEYKVIETEVGSYLELIEK
jgi:hypothetical protein